VKDHLHYAVVLMDNKIIASQIGQAERQLSAKSRVYKTRTQKDALPPERGPAPKRSGKIHGQLDPFKRGDERTYTFRKETVTGGPQIVGCGLLTLAAVGCDDEVSPSTILIETADYLWCG
jgi:hypothetical protein